MKIEIYEPNIQEIEDSFKDKSFIDNKCGVYCFYDKENIYVGESTTPLYRLKQHKGKDKLKKEHKIIIFRSEKFNKSVIWNIETNLINYFHSEQKYKLININTTQNNHNYYLKPQYEPIIKTIWNFFLEEGISKYKIEDIEQMDIFKFSPYKSLNSNQKYVLEEIQTNKNKKMFLINGYPGTGKSILASAIYGKISKKQDVALVSGTTSIHETFKKIFKNHNKNIKTKSKILKAHEIINNNQHYDLIIIDEAQRLLRKEGKGHVSITKHLEKNQNDLDELMKKCKQIIVLYDENQIVSDADFFFKKINYKNKKEFFLKEQMRLNNGYKFINSIMSFLDGQIIQYNSSKNYDVKIFNNFKEMYLKLKEKCKQFPLTRLLSGYTRKWKTKSKKNEQNDLYDFEIDGINLRWNSQSKKWINTEKAKNLEEVAYYNTIQGFDLDYAGVIIGKDLYLDENDNIQINEEFVITSMDKPNKLRESAEDYKKKLRLWVINRYRILLTRGIQGTYLYIEDEKLRDKLKQIFNK